MADSVRHEALLAYRRELHRKRMKEDPAYREKLRKRAKANNAKRRALHQADPQARASYNRQCSLRRKAYRDFMKSTPKGRAELRKKESDARIKRMSNPASHEKMKAAYRRAKAKYIQSDRYKRDLEKAKRLRQKKAKARAYARLYRKTHADARREWEKKWISANPKAYSARIKRINDNRKARCSSDPEYYAKIRQHKRDSYKAKRLAQGKSYVSRPSRRIPDTCTFGNIIDTSSVFLRNNLSKDQELSAESFAMEIAIENRDYAHSHNIC